MPPVAPGFLKKEAFAGANSAIGTNCKANDTGASPHRAAAGALAREEGEMLTRRNIVVVVGLLAVLAGGGAGRGGGGGEVARGWPGGQGARRPITMVVPFAAGGPTDVVGRLVADRLGDVLGQQVIVENIGGAGGMNGAQRVAVANPDGYQVLLGTVGTQAYNQTL